MSETKAPADEDNSREGRKLRFSVHSHIIKTFSLKIKIIHDPFGPFLPGTRSKPRLLWQNTLLDTLLKKECKKSVFGEASLSHHGCSWPLVAQERPEGRPHHPLHCTAVTAEAPRSTRVRSRLHLAYGTVGAELAFLAVCWFSYSEPESVEVVKWLAQGEERSGDLNHC